MSAVGAIFNRDGSPVIESNLFKLNQGMLHHGQDESRVWFKQSCGLVQQTTHLTAESRYETFPHLNAKHQIALVAHCRLFNRKELAEQLNLPKNHSQIGDSQFIVLAYLKWRLAFVDYLVGEYSLVLWDAQQEQLLCVTDHFNARPLYYYIDAKRVVVASEISALHQLADVPRKPNLNKIARSDLMRFQLEVGETCFEKIQSLPAAHLMVISAGNLSVQQYWQPELGACFSFKSDDVFREAFQGIFQQVVESTTRTHVPIALQLSGGLDSSAIAMMASAIFKGQGRNLICLSNVLPRSYQGDLKDERAFIDLMHAPNLIKEDILDARRGPFDELVSFGKQLNLSPQHYQHRAMNSVARHHQARIVLHGTLGELTTSYAAHEYLAYKFSHGQWLSLMREVHAHKKNYKRSYAGIIAHHIIQPQLAYLYKKPAHHRARALDLSLINSAFIQQHIHANDFEQIILKYKRLGCLSSVNPRENALLQLKNYMQHSSELFHAMDESPRPAVYFSNPYFDKRLVEFCLNVPNHYRYRDGYPRSMIRIGMQNYLPKEICFRTTKDPFIPDYFERYNQQLGVAQAAVKQLSQNKLVQEVINVKQLEQHLSCSSGSSRLNPHQDFMNFLVVPRMIYLAQFLSSF